MPIDASIIPTQNKLPDYQGFASNLFGLAQRNLQVKQLQQQQAANQAVSQAIQANTDDQGNVNTQGVLMALAKNPSAAYNLPEYAQRLYGAEGAKQTANNARLEGITKQLNYWDSQLGGLTAMGDKITKNDVLKTLGRAIGTGMLTPDLATRYASEIPEDPTQVAGWVKNHWVGLQDSKNQVQLLTPQIQVLNTGGATNIAAINPLTGDPRITGAIQNTMTPGEAATPVQLTTPSGTPYMTTKGQFAAQTQGQVPGMQAPGMQGQMPGKEYTGRSTGEIPPGGVQAGLSPAEQARQSAGATVQAQESAKAAQDLHNSAADVPMRVNLLNQARDALSGIQTGPGADWRNQAKSFLNALSPEAAKKLGYTGEVKDFDEFKKIMTNYSSSVSGSLGGGTDARLNAAITGNANPNISKLANDDILVKTIAAEKMRAAQDYAWQNAGLPPDQFNKWQSQWNNKVNPDVFAFAEMNPTQKQEFINRYTKSGKLDKFKSQLGEMVRSGIVEMPGAQ